jgi:hypothetical protein
MQTDPQTTKSSNPKDVLARSEQRVLLHLVPSPALVKTALALMDGARKYGPYNWRDEGVSASTYVSAAERHIRAWLDGETDAADSKVHHLGHAIACLAIILDAEAIGNLVDDRPRSAPTAALLEAEKSKAATNPAWTLENANDLMELLPDSREVEPPVDDLAEELPDGLGASNRGWGIGR